ncbi:hypothetical protein BZG36_05389, partial [Bifiguratus adelaidae]
MTPMAREKRVSDDEDEDERYVVEEIVATKTNKNGTFYEVKWENYPPSANTWEPEENLMQDCPHLVRDFLKKQSKPKTTSKTPKKKRAAEAFDEEDNIDVMDLVDDESWPLERTNWQKEVDKIASCERSKDGQLVHYVR